MYLHWYMLAPTEGIVMVHVEVVSTEELGDRSYIAHDGEAALVVDPQRDIDRVECLLSDRGLGCALVLETHVLYEYVGEGQQFASPTGPTSGFSIDPTET